MKQVLSLISVILFLSSCTKVIDYDLSDSQSRIVVDGLITNETKAHLVKLTKTGSYYENTAPVAIIGADVSISDGTSTFTLHESPVGSGNYYTDPTVKGEIGKTYTLKITYEDEEYTASSYLNPVTKVDSMEVLQLFEEQPISHEIDSAYSILLYAQELPGKGNYYEWDYYVNNVLGSDTLKDRVFSDDAVVDGNYIYAFPIYDVDTKYIHPGDSVSLEMKSISKQQYEFMTSLMLETEWRGSPFDGPPANISTNLSNGALGFFGASAVSRKTVMVD